MVSKNDVIRRVEVAELQRSMKRSDSELVQLWVHRVKITETQVTQLVSHRAQEIHKLCCGGFCSKNYLSSYKYGKKVADVLVEVNSLKNKASSQEVAAESFDVAA